MNKLIEIFVGEAVKHGMKAGLKKLGYEEPKREPEKGGCIMFILFALSIYGFYLAIFTYHSWWIFGASLLLCTLSATKSLGCAGLMTIAFFFVWLLFLVGR